MTRLSTFDFPARVAAVNGGRSTRDFWLLWGASTVSNFGDGIRQAALPLVAVSLTTDPLAIGAVTAATWLPWLLSLPSGAAVDRVNRRRLMIIAQILRGVAVTGFAALVLSDQVALAFVYLVAFVAGSGEVVVESAFQAAIPHVAGEDLETANSRMASGQFLAGNIVGGPLTGALFAVSMPLPFVIDAVSFIPGVGLIWLLTDRLQEPTDETQPSTTVFEDIGQGLRFLVDQPVLRGIAVALALSNLANAAFTALMVLLVVDVLGGSEFQFGLVLAAGAAGGFVGSLAGAWFARSFGRRRTLLIAPTMMVMAMAAAAIVDSVIVVGIAVFVVLCSVGLMNVSVQSIRQRITPDRLLGRVVASTRFFAFGAVPVGAIGGGLVARLIGVQGTMLVAAVVSIGALAALALSTRSADLENPAAV